VRERAVRGVHDCSDGGLAVAVAEMAIAGRTGAELTVDTTGVHWFSESTSRVVLSVDRASVPALLGRADAAGVAATVIGTVGGDRLRAPGAFDVALDDATAAWRDAIPRALGNEPAAL
jgi:phosphoribosylformylglycinamidine synthase